MAQLINVVQLASQLGLAPQTIYNRVSQSDDLPVVTKIGRCVRFEQSAVDEWVKGKVAAVDRPTVADQLPVALTMRKRGRPTKAEQISARRTSKDV